MYAAMFTRMWFMGIAARRRNSQLAMSKKHTRTFVPEEREDEEEADPTPFCMPVGVRQPHEIEFSGDLTPSVAAYLSATQIMCGKCDINSSTPCLTCKRPFAHMKVAMNQPFTSVMCTTPILFAALFPNKRNFAAVPYHTLVMGYSAVFVHLQDLLDPDREYFTPEWTQVARERRTWAWNMWRPWVHKHTQDICGAFDTSDQVEGRKAVMTTYQEVICTGLRVARAKSQIEFETGLSEELAILNTPLHETGASPLSEVKDFNKTHVKWQADWEKERLLRKSMQKLSV